MAKLLYIQASPRDGRSRSIQVAQAFLEAYRKANPRDQIETIDLFERDLPTFDGAVIESKYVVLHGEKPTGEQAKAWRAVEELIAEFVSADKYLLAVPMWNFGVPYRLKQYIDNLVQPGYTFAVTPDGNYEGLVLGKRAMLAYARGGDYHDADPTAADFQRRYMETILGFIGITDVRSVVVEPTLMGGPDVGDQKTQAAMQEAEKMVVDF
jgi:FMN-dependent NADH-azoreductase